MTYYAHAGSRVTRVQDSRQGTVVATDTRNGAAGHLAMVMWDQLSDGTANTGGRAYWHQISTLVVL